jgi:carboxylesterase type B
LLQGRDDKLFSGAIAESGGPGNLFSATSNGIGYNNTAYQTSYDTLVSTTGCGNATSTLSCLRALPYETLNTALNSSIPGVGPFIPFIDNDFVATYPSIQLRNGDFVKVPLLIGTNSDEGNSFSPRGVVNTDAQFLSMLNQTLYSAPPSISAIISYVYPNIPALGVPSFSTWPYSPNSTIAKALGSQIRRVQAYFGDLAVNAPRRFANHQWASHGVESYSYRFDVTVGGLPAYVGATHFQEVSFVFNNTRGEGYAVNPFTANLTASESLKLQELSKYMSRSWVSFIVHDGNPNLHGLSGKPTWPAYSTANGALGDNIVWTTKGNESGAVVEVDAYRVEGMNFINENLLGVYGR